jgi:MYXO-CTERM domain-containing protein
MHRPALAITLCVLTLHATAAWACTPSLVTHQRIEPLTVRDVAQSAMLVVDSNYGADPAEDTQLVLKNSEGDELPMTRLRRESYVAPTDGALDTRTWYEPVAPLPPGDYTLEHTPEPGRDDTVSSPFRVNDDLPPTAPPAPPKLQWRAVLFDGPEQPPLIETREFVCGGPFYDDRVARHLFESTSNEPGVQGFITLTLETTDGPLEALSDYGGFDPTLRIERDFVLSAPHIQCVEATFTDIYGNTSEPTRSCEPDGCEARNRNDRSGRLLEDLDECSDWSPGYVERNAPGCACAQVPSTPSGSPAALALGLLGLVALRRRL